MFPPRSLLLLVVLFAVEFADGAGSVPPGPLPSKETTPRSPDGKLIASASAETIALHETAPGKEPRQLHGHSGPVNALAFSVDGRLLASASADRTARVWSVASGKAVLVMSGHVSAVRCLAFSRDSRLLATAGDDRTIRIWELASGQEVLRLRGPSWPGATIAFQPDGKGLLVGDSEDGVVLLLNPANGKQLDRWTLQRLQATLADPVLAKGKRTALRVQAHWSGGGTQDVTAWTGWESLDLEVARRAEGQVEAKGPGRTAIAARYLGREAAVAITVPYAVIDDYPKLSSANFIDEALIPEWKRAGLKPAELASDSTFLRRVTLHLTGSLPSPEDVQRFLASKELGKRGKLIASLLDSPAYTDHWAREWLSLLRSGEKTLGEKERETLRSWLHKALRENRPLDRLGRELLTAEGEVRANGAAALFLIDRTPEAVAETAAQVFLGVNLRCARCHRHPNGEWSREDYLGLSAFFSGIERQAGAVPTVRHGSGVLAHPVTGKAVLPRPPGPPEPVIGREGPVHGFARWMTHADNPAFARNLVNRYWAHLFGRALADPCVGARLTSQPALLEALTRDFIKHRYDVKHLLRTMCQSRAYQLGYAPVLAEDKVFHSRRYLQRLSGEPLTRLVAQASGVKFEALRIPDWIGQAEEDAAPFRRRRPDGDGTDCERPRPDAIPVAPFFPFGDNGLLDAINHPQGRIARMLAAGEKDEKIIEELFLTTISRPATKQENMNVAAHMAKAKGPAERKSALQDILWACINSKEFIFIP